MTRSSTRRRYITASVAAGIAALAGCSDLIEEYDEAEEPEGDDPDDESVEDVDHENPEGELEFVSPEDGDEVTSPVEVEMEVENFELQPAEDDESEDDDQTGAPDDGAGHLHVIVDEECVDPGYVIPQEDGYHHLSEGETETELDLEPGEYDLCAQAGDDQHNAYDLTDEITIEVTEERENGDEDDGADENGDGNGANGDDGDETDGENGNDE